MERRTRRALAQRAVLASALSASLVVSSGSLALADAANGASGTTAASVGAATAGGSGTAASTSPPKAPYALNPTHNLASFVLPVTGYSSAQLASAGSIDTSVAPVSALTERTYADALAQWEAQGAQPVSSNTTIPIDPTKYTNVQTDGTSADTVKVGAPGSVQGNTSPAMEWPTDVTSVDYPFYVTQTGLYELQFNYYAFPSCFANGATTIAQITGADNAANAVTPWCGRGSSAERGIQIDPPGTVPAVPPPVQTVSAAEQQVVQQAIAAGVQQASLPGWIDPTKTQVVLQPTPAWAMVPQAPPASSSTGSGGASTSSTAASGTAASGTAASSTAASSTAASGTAASGTAASSSTSATSAAGAASSTAAAPAASAVTIAPAAVQAPALPPTPACALNLTDPNGQPESYDGYQYTEAEQVPFSDIWQERGGTVDPKTGYVSFPKDNRGDDLYPIPQEAEAWQTVDAHDALGTYRDPLQFCLAAGYHVLRLSMVREPMAIQSITFHGAPTLPTYQQALASWQSQGMKPVTCGLCLQESAVNIYRMSDETIRPGSDSNPGVVPETNGYNILNELDGSYFQSPNEWVEWKITVPQTGLYKLSFKELQAGLQGLPAGRTLRIDGQLPFDGAQWISIPFKNGWNVVTLSQPNGKPALIGLTKGTHILRMGTTLGLVGQSLEKIQQAAQRLDELQREILMITGPNPQPTVTYNLDKNVPGLIPQMQSVVAVLHEQAALLTYAAGGTPPVAANSINITADDINQLANHPEQIQLNMQRWSNDEQSLAQWIFLLEQQPVSLDWLDFTSPGYKLPAAGAPFLLQLKVLWQTFILSFYRDYTGVGSVYNNAITVWVGFGQLWAALMSQMAISEFTPATGIHVNFNVVPGGAGIVLLAQVSGHGPDVATGMPATTPVDFALRDGAYDMTQFPNWQNVLSRFVPNATLPYQYRDATGHTGTYGLPETQGMQLLFYRKDILDSLGITSPPSTWPELYQELPLIESKGMEFYYPVGATGLLPFLYQNGGEYYTTDPTSGGLVSDLNTTQGYNAVKEWTDLFSQWKVPLSANFFTRFQTGEMPIGIADYNQYVQFNAAAPQLAGLWGIAPIPGEPYQCENGTCVDSVNAATSGASGALAVPQPKCEYPDVPNEPALPAGITCQINRTSGDNGSSNAIIIPKSAKNPQAAWEFVEWWTATATQLQFAQEILAVAGVQAAWNTANVQALSGLPWPQQDLNVFEKAWSNYKPAPVVPGGYVADRYVNNVWTNVVIDGQNVRQQLEWATQNIDDELYRQEVQFGLTKSVTGKIAIGA